MIRQVRPENWFGKIRQQGRKRLYFIDSVIRVDCKRCLPAKYFTNSVELFLPDRLRPRRIWRQAKRRGLSAAESEKYIPGLVMVVDSLEHKGSGLLLNENIVFALRWLQSAQTAQLPSGKYELRGQSLYAIVDEYMTRPRGTCMLETHRRYIDVQYVVRGRELMGYAPIQTLDPGHYDEERDVQFHQGHADFLLLRQGMFAVMLPGDGHMPSVAVDNQPEQVKKIVVKVAVDMPGGGIQKPEVRSQNY